MSTSNNFKAATATMPAPTAAGPSAAAWPALSIAQAHAAMTAPGQLFEMTDVTVRGVPLRCWKNAPATMRDAFNRSRGLFGERDFLILDGERVSVEAFARASVALAHALQAQGIGKGDRIVIATRNLPEFPVAAFAALLLGAIATPLNAWWSGEELRHGITDSGARVAICDAERWARLAPHCQETTTLERVLIVRHAEARSGNAPQALPDTAKDLTISTLESLIGKPAQWAELPALALPTVDLAPDDDAMILYTSGTTGVPKGALSTHRCTTNALFMGMFARARNFVRQGVPVPDPTARPVPPANLVSIPFFHTTGCHVILFGALFTGTKLVMMRKWDAETAMRLIEQERIQSAGGVPTIAWDLVEHPARDRYDLSSLEMVSYGGAPSSAGLVKRIQSELPHAAPGNGYGMTETTGVFAQHSARDFIERPESCGPALPVNDVKVVDDEGNALPPGQTGELLLKGPTIIRSYWGKPAETAETLQQGWLRTGDVARIDEEGFLYIVDRKKNMLIRGGENIYNAEIEDVLCRHPAIMDAGVVAIAHATLGEEPGALVTLKPGARASEAQLQAFVARHLAAFKVPVRIVVLTEALPRNPTGKLMRHALQALFSEHCRDTASERNGLPPHDTTSTVSTTS